MKKPDNERLIILLNNAIGYMAESGMSDKEITQYLGSTEEELNSIEVLGWGREEARS
jgi:hypothetical protein